ncbi:uncharacterized protein [Arachis hypogaea]|uniref:uncharacterized protein n=1 Tax=Arachis hypogaea TaxID=3818 RepID=UPI003B217E5C
MELVVLDKEGSRIYCFIRSIHYRLFETILEEGKVFVLANFTMDSNTQKYRPTKHSMRIIFKRDTLVSSVDDINIPIESFDFVVTKEILSSVRDDLFLIGVMTITNTNYTTRLMVNADLEVVKKFRQKLIGLGTKHKPSVDVIGRVVRHFPSEDFLNLTPYAPIHQIKQTVEKSTYVTCGMVIDIDRDHAWWYKACRQCTQGLEALIDQFYCAKCDVYSTIFVARLVFVPVWLVRVVDDSDIATFVLFENSASKFLGLTATDIRTSMLAKGYRRDHFPEELNALDALQKLTTATGVHSGELIRNGSIVGVAGSTTPLSTKAASVSEHGADHVVTQTPVKRLCIRSDDDLSSRASLSASKSLLLAFEKCIPGNATDPVAEDM